MRLATSEPGAIHLLNGLYDAKLDHQPVVAIVGQTARSAMGGAYQQEVELISLFKDVASDFVNLVAVPEQIPAVNRPGVPGGAVAALGDLCDRACGRAGAGVRTAGARVQDGPVEPWVRRGRITVARTRGSAE